MATINDVAKRAGLSVSTVSRVFNNRGYISEQTRQKVMDVSRELGYYPSEVARALQRKHTNVIGVIVPYISHPFFSSFVQALDRVCSAKGYKIMLCNSNHEADKEREYAEMLKRNQVDGIIISSRTRDVTHFLDRKMPIVSIERVVAESVPTIMCDNENGGIIAADALLDRGSKHPLLLGGRTPMPTSPDAVMPSEMRMISFINRCRERGVQMEYDVIASDFLENDPVDALAETLAKHPDIDGIFATGDVQAVYAITACTKKLGKRVPEDIQVIGYDGTDLALYNGLSTIEQPVDEMAKYAMDLLMSLIGGGVTPSSVTLPVRFVQRRTTVSID